ncbi:MAG: low molecular weight protein arginine phosphatase [Gemmatimonadales bacterium]|nr:low molecular weight protein arginine phosphatase [Gemmatimonadales bacterium]
MHVLFVCTGNTCRSPLAAAILADRLAKAGVAGIEVSSAGISPIPDAPASEGSYLVAMEHGLDLSAHRARLLTPSLVKQADRILTMGGSHLARVAGLGGQEKSELLGHYAGVNGRAAEVADPIGGPLDDYRATYDQIAAFLDAALPRLLREAASAGR